MGCGGVAGGFGGYDYLGRLLVKLLKDLGERYIYLHIHSLRDQLQFGGRFL